MTRVARDDCGLPTRQITSSHGASVDWVGFDTFGEISDSERFAWYVMLFSQNVRTDTKHWTGAALREFRVSYSSQIWKSPGALDVTVR